MPIELIDETNIKVLPGVGRIATTPDDEDESLIEGTDFEIDQPTAPIGEVFSAAFRQENTLVAGYNMLTRQAPGPVDPDFIPTEHIEGFEDDAMSFAKANTIEEVDRIKEKIIQERFDRQTIAESGGLGIVAMLAAGIVDPINFIPIAGVTYKTYRTGANILKSATATAKAGALSSTAAEAVLHADQITRTWGESAVNVAASTFLSGVIGGGVGAIKSAKFNAMAKNLEADLEVPRPGAPDPIIPETVPMSTASLAEDTGSIGAAAVRGTTIAEDTLKSALGVEKLVKFQDPLLRTASSVSLKTRQIGQMLAEQVLKYNKNALGIETPLSVETRVAGYDAGLYKAMRSVDDNYIQYLKGRERKFGDITRAKIGELPGVPRRSDKLTTQQFKEEISHAMRNGDKHEIPEVQAAAVAFRRDVFDPLKDEAIKLGLLPEDVDVKTADSYLMRVYDREKIIATRPEFRATIERYLRSERDIAAERILEVERELVGVRAELKGILDEVLPSKKDQRALEKELLAELNKLEFKVGFEDQELSFTSDQIIDRILGTPDGRLPYDINPNASKGGGGGGLSGPLKGRSFLIPDAMIEEWLENDIEHLARVYTRSLAPDVELVRAFGDVNMTAHIEEIRADYARKTDAELGEKELKMLHDRMENDIRDIAAMRDRIRGTYAVPADPSSTIVRAGRLARSWNYVRLLGGMTASAFPDVWRTTMIHGMKRTLRDGVVPMMKNFKAFRMSAEETKLAGTALDMLLNTRAAKQADIMDNYGRHSKLERGVDAMTNKFGIASAMAPWNAFWKQFAGMVTQTRILQTAEAITNGTAKKADIELLASQGINPEMAKKLWSNFELHGTITDGIYLPNTSAWEDVGDAELLALYRGAVKKEVDIIIVTPGEDKPLWMSAEMGKTIGQFKSFSFASTQRTLLTGLQQRDTAALIGAFNSTIAGMAVYGFKTLDSGRETSDDPAIWMSEGLDRSGLFGWFFEANNIIEKASRGNVGINAAIGGPQMSRFASRNVTGAIIGPTAGLMQDVFSATGNLSDGEWKESDTRAFRRLLPYQNLIAFRRLLDQAERGINQTVGAKK